MTSSVWSNTLVQHDRNRQLNIPKATFSLNSDKISPLGLCRIENTFQSYDKYQFQNMFPWIIDNTQRYVNEHTTYVCRRWLWIHTSRGKSVQGNRWRRSESCCTRSRSLRCVAGKVGLFQHPVTFTTRGYTATVHGAQRPLQENTGNKGGQEALYLGEGSRGLTL